MATKTAKKTKLREDLHGSPIDRIDREEGVIYGVKILGGQSRNKRTYSEAAMKGAISLYEGAVVNIDHKFTEGERSLGERWGVLRNVTYREGALYGDLHYLKSHPLTPQLLEAAERFPDKFGLSHMADGHEESTPSGKVVTAIDRVYSVDVVGDPATNKGLFESEGTMKKTIKTLVESNKETKRKAFHAALVEMMGTDPMMGDVPVEMASDELSSEDQIDAAFRAVMVSILDDEALDDAAKLAKLKSVLAAKSDAVAAVGGETPSETEKAMEESNKQLKAENAKLVEQVAKFEAEAKKATDLATVTKLLVESKREVNQVRINALLKATEDERKDLIEQWLPTGDTGGKKPEKSPSKFAEGAEESYAPKSYEDFKKALV